MTTAGATPLGAMLARLDAADPYCRAVAGVPDGAGWTLVRDLLVEPMILESWFRELRTEHHGQADVAGSFLAGWLGGIVLDPVGWAFHVERRAWPLDPDVLWLHRHEEGWFDGFAVASPSLDVLPDDPDAAHPDVRIVADLDVLRRSIARDAVAVLMPLFAAVRRLAPFGIRGMWGNLADSVASNTVSSAFRHAEPTTPAFEAAMALVDELVVAGAGAITRPSPEPVGYSRGTTTVVHKGTCCLWYKVAGTDAPAGERYCLSCPKQPESGQRARWVAWLDEVAAERAPAGSE